MRVVAASCFAIAVLGTGCAHVEPLPAMEAATGMAAGAGAAVVAGNVHVPGPRTKVYVNADGKGNGLERVFSAPDASGSWTIVTHEGGREALVVTLSRDASGGVLISSIEDRIEKRRTEFAPPMLILPERLAPDERSEGSSIATVGKARTGAASVPLKGESGPATCVTSAYLDADGALSLRTVIEITLGSTVVTRSTDAKLGADGAIVREREQRTIKVGGFLVGAQDRTMEIRQ